MASGSNPVRSKRSEAIAGAITAVNATGLGVHLGVSRQRIANMVTEGIIVRLPSGGFDQDLCRLAYISWLQRDNRRSPRVEADARYQATRHELLELQLMKVRGATVMVEDVVAVFEGFVAYWRSQITSLPARIGGRSIPERARIDKICDTLIDEMRAEFCKRKKACAIEGRKWLSEHPDYQEIPPVYVGDEDEDEDE